MPQEIHALKVRKFVGVREIQASNASHCCGSSVVRVWFPLYKDASLYFFRWFSFISTESSQSMRHRCVMSESCTRH